MESATDFGRWLRAVARIWSVVSLMIIGLFAIGEGSVGQYPLPTAAEWVGLTLFPLGLALGLVIGWWREGFGGTIALLSLAAFYLLNWWQSGAWPSGPYFALLTVPGLLFVLSAWLTRSESDRLAMS